MFTLATVELKQRFAALAARRFRPWASSAAPFPRSTHLCASFISPLAASRMQGRVFSRNQHTQILDAVIRTIAVDMMNDFISGKFATKMLLHNETMEEVVLATRLDADVSITDATLQLSGMSKALFVGPVFTFFGHDAPPMDTVYHSVPYEANQNRSINL